MEKLENAVPTENKVQKNEEDEKEITEKGEQQKTDSTTQDSNKKNSEVKTIKKKEEESTTKNDEKISNKKSESKSSPFNQKKIEEFFLKKDKEKTTEKKADDTMQLKAYKSKGNKRKKLVISLIIIIALLTLIISTVFGILTSSNDKIVHGISISGINISNLTKQEALSKLTTDLKDDFNKDIILTRGEYSITINANDIGASYDIEESVESAYNIGRSGNNIFANNFNVLKSLISKTNIAPSIKYDNDLLDEKLDTIDKEIPDRVVSVNYKIEENNLIISSGSDGYRTKRDELKNTILSALANNDLTIEIPVEQYHTDDVDIDAIHKEIYKEPVDATFKSEPYELHKEENGLDFAIPLEEARTMVADRQDTYTIPLKVLYPKITVKSLPKEAFPDELATYSTTYASSNYNRSQNISIATNSVNGTVLMPGETFSYNETLGQRTTAKGYREAGAYVNGQLSNEVGGGICQVSSTLYNAALLTNLEIVARTNHSFESSYVPAGQDATVSWRSPDFQFKNNREYPIKIVASAGSGKVTFIIYGVKSPDDYEVKIQSSKTSSIPFSTSYENDPSLPVGTTKIKQSGSNGCRSVTYKILYKDGQEVSRTLINSDTYKPHDQIVVRGTQQIPESTPDETTPSPSQPEVTDEPAVVVTNETPEE